MVLKNQLSMKAAIYYFTGTGNSLIISKHLAKQLENSELIPLDRVINQNDISPDAGIVGIIYPVYALGCPEIIINFINRLRLNPNQYLFIIANYAGLQGAAISKVKRLIRRRGLNLKAAFGIAMPGNYTPLYGAEPKKKQQALFIGEQRKIAHITERIRARKKLKPETGFFLARWILWELFCAIISKRLKKADKNFWITKRCNSCGTCALVCPVINIEMSAGKPAWRHNCQQCFRCFHWCPQEAIEYGNKTIDRKRYRHPQVKLEEMLRKSPNLG